MNVYKFFSIFFLLAALSNGKAQNLGTVPSTTNPPNFAKLSYEKADEAVASEEDLIETGMRKTDSAYVSNLVYQIQSGQLSHDNKALAIDLLGASRPNNTNSIECLIRNIDFVRTRFDPPTRISAQSKYPAAAALVKIGKPAIDPILNYLPGENSELRRSLLCNVLKTVLRQCLDSQTTRSRLNAVQKDYGVTLSIHDHWLTVGTSGLIPTNEMSQISDALRKALGDDFSNYTVNYNIN
jgi:hypothetical protein